MVLRGLAEEGERESFLLANLLTHFSWEGYDGPGCRTGWHHYHSPLSQVTAQNVRAREEKGAMVDGWNECQCNKKWNKAPTPHVYCVPFWRNI